MNGTPSPLVTDARGRDTSSPATYLASLPGGFVVITDQQGAAKRAVRIPPSVTQR